MAPLSQNHFNFVALKPPLKFGAPQEDSANESESESESDEDPPTRLRSCTPLFRVRAKAADDRRYLAGALAYHARRMETTSSGEGAGPKEGPRGGSKEQGKTPLLTRARRHTHAHTCARNTHATPPLLPSSARHCPSPPGRTSRVYTPPRNGQGSPRFTAHRELPVPSSPSSRLRKIVLKSISRRPTQTTSQQAPNTSPKDPNPHPPQLSARSHWAG